MAWKLDTNKQVWDMIYTLSVKGTEGGIKMDVNWNKPVSNENQNWDSIKSFIKISMGLREHKIYYVSTFLGKFENFNVANFDPNY